MTKYVFTRKEVVDMAQKAEGLNKVLEKKRQLKDLKTLRRSLEIISIPPGHGAYPENDKVMKAYNSIKRITNHYEYDSNLEQTAEKGEPIFREAKVLVVDDLEKWLNDATNNLIYYGCKRENILWAYDVKNGERIYIAERPPVSLVDINFDVDNPEDTQGLSLIQKIKEIKSKGVVVAMSSLTDIESRTRDAGADYFIQKGKQFTANFDGFVEWYKKR